MISKPETHRSTTNEYIKGRKSNFPPAAKYPPMGARLKPNPSMKWQRKVNLFV